MKRYMFFDEDAQHTELQPDSMPTAIVGQPDSHPDNQAPCTSFDIPDSVPHANGADLRITKGRTVYTFHGILDTKNPGGGGFEVDVYRLPKTGGVRPFVRDEHFLRYADDGTEMLVNLATGFRAFSRFANGEAAQLDAFMQSCVDHHINMIRVAAMQDTTLYLSDPALQYRIHPAEHPNFYTELVPGFNDYAAAFGIYVKWIFCAQTQTLMGDKGDQVRHIYGMYGALFDKYCLGSKVNEQYLHDNTIDDAARILPKPAGATFLLSTGSKGAGDESVLEPVADFIEYHTNDINEWWRKGGHNGWEMANRNGRPCLTSEETRTDKELERVGADAALRHYEDAAKTEVAMSMGAIIHTPEGKNADPFDFSVPFIEAHNRGTFDGGVDFRRGQYDRFINPQVLREYSMTWQGVYRWQVRF
jgi:hypothetical protein